MKTENEKNQSTDKAADSQVTKIIPLTEVVSGETFPCELNDPQWSVISFSKCEATDLTYQEAVRKLKTIAKKGGFGLCIVTNQAAQKITTNTFKCSKTK